MAILRAMRGLIFGLLALLAVHAHAAEMPQTLALGSAAPDFKLRGVDDKTYRLKSFSSSKLLTIIFTCNHCPTAQAYEDRIKQLVDDYKAKGVAFVAINPNDPKSIRLNELGYTDLSDSFDEMKTRATFKEFNFPYLDDGENQRVSRAYGPVATPHVFVFDQARKLRYTGRIDDNERPEKVKSNDLRNALDDLLAAREVKVPQAKVFGCSVKWAGKKDAVKDYMKQVAEEPVVVEPVTEDGLKALRKNDSGNYRLINVWATWCGVCVAEFPDLVTINRMYRHREFEFVTIAAHLAEDEQLVTKFLKKQQSSGKNFILSGTNVVAMIEKLDPEWTGALPFTMLINPKGEVVFKEEGEIEPLELRRKILNAMGRVK
ncbi:MAG: redoxin protein [Verrucomicrobiales bacterium]|nr:redoxin protein [Verrucomicrobiales bacterium]